MANVYLVWRASGSYSDYRTEIIAAYYSQAAAEKHVINAKKELAGIEDHTRRIRDHANYKKPNSSWGLKRIEELRRSNNWDPNGICDDTYDYWFGALSVADGHSPQPPAKEKAS